MTGKIIIKAVPDGEAPLDIRQEWVGCTMQCTMKTTAKKAGVFSGKDGGVAFGYIVNQAVALEALEKKSLHAASWWRGRGFPQQGKHFMFDEKAVAEIHAVPRVTIVVADNMEMGFFELPGR